MFVPGTVTCVLLPRFSLTTASGERRELLTQPVALAPEPGGRQQVGEVSLAAEAFGIHSGMRLGEALARCPRLTLVPPDPAGVADAWERLLVRLEAVGVAVEPERPGLVCFDARGLLRLHGGTSLAAARPVARRAEGGPRRRSANRPASAWRRRDLPRWPRRRARACAGR